MSIFSSISLAVFVYPILFGVTMKIADLTNEHGLKLFKGDKYVFGILWGIFGGLILLESNILANFIIALLVHWILRYRIDYLNHGISASIILIVFLLNIGSFELDYLLFFLTFVLYTVHGLFNDSADRGEMKGIFAKYFGLNSHYFTIPILLTLINPLYWVTIPISALHLLSYETTKKLAHKKGYY